MMVSSCRSLQFPWRLLALVAGAQAATGADEVNTTVIIIGAGLSGLGAAKTLHEYGVDYILLEGRDILGGRVREGQEVGNYFKWKYGPYLIYGSQTESGEPQVMYEAATSRYVNASLVLVDYNNITVRNRSGTVIDPEVVEKFFGRQDEMYSYCLAKYEELWERGEDLDVPESIDITYAACWAEAGWRENVTDPLEIQVAEVAQWDVLDFEYALRPEELSTMWSLPINNDYLDEEWFVRDQLVATVQQLAGPVASSDALRFSQKVTKVTYSKGQVKVETEQGLVVNGKMVICTLPLGVLKKRTVEWDPPFSEARLRSIDEMGLGGYAKVLMQFPAVWWDNAEVMYVAGDYSSGLVKVILNFDHPKYHPGSKCIEIHLTRDLATTVENSSPEEAEAMMLAELRAVFPMETIPAPDLVLISNWTYDEYAYGAYSSWPINYTEEEWYEMIGSINDTVFFAGEHTSDNYGYMHSAFLSGVSTVEDEILPALGLINVSTTEEMMMTSAMTSAEITTSGMDEGSTTGQDGNADGAPARGPMALMSLALLALSLGKAIS